jgi:hypothetical protein
VYLTQNFLEIGKTISSSNRVNKTPPWVTQIIGYIQRELNLDMPTKFLLLDRWARKQTWISKRIFGEESDGQRSEMDQVRAFHPGMENIPGKATSPKVNIEADLYIGSLVGLWLAGLYREPRQTIAAMAAQLGINIQLLWYTGEIPPPYYTWRARTFPEREGRRISEQDRDPRNVSRDTEEGIRLTRSFRWGMLVCARGSLSNRIAVK